MIEPMKWGRIMGSYENAHHPYDGATPAQELERLTNLTSFSNQLVLKLRNEFTEACDEHLREEYSRDLGNAFSTELWMDLYPRQNEGSDTVIVFRFPGATRGHIKVNPYTCQITEVKFYQEVAIAESIGCYKESVLALEQEFTGHYFDGDSGLLIRALLSDGAYYYMDSTLRAKYLDSGLGNLADMLNNPTDGGAL